jgi:hypothetical protein
MPTGGVSTAIAAGKPEDATAVPQRSVVVRCSIGSRKAGRPAVIDDAAVRPVCVAAVNDRPHHRIGDRRCAGLSWHTVSSIAIRAVTELIATAGPDRLTGVRVIGVDEHRWVPRRPGAPAPRRVGAASFVALIIDLTPTLQTKSVVPVSLLRLRCR